MRRMLPTSIDDFKGTHVRWFLLSPRARNRQQFGRTPRIRRFAVHYWVRRKEYASWEARVDKELIQVEHIREWIRREQGHETDG